MLFILIKRHIETVKITTNHSHPTHSPKQRDDHDNTHELCEEDKWSEEGPHWPQCQIKAAREETQQLQKCTM